MELKVKSSECLNINVKKKIKQLFIK